MTNVVIFPGRGKSPKLKMSDYERSLNAALAKLATGGPEVAAVAKPAQAEQEAEELANAPQTMQVWPVHD